MESHAELRREIINTLEKKSALKQAVFDRTFALLGDIKEALHEFSTEIDEETDDTIDRRIRIEYRDRGKFEAQIQVAGDMLILTMHTNVFRFPSDHEVWKTDYVAADRQNAFFGVINVYNFLADSFKYNRSEDEGYLIGRIFVNREGAFFVDSKWPNQWNVEEFGTQLIDRDKVLQILESAILYSLHFDLLIPPYETVKQVNVEQFNSKLENSKLQTGKRMGYDFDAEDL